MTEPRGRAARWRSSLLLVPGAAVSFGAAVAWAAGTTPTGASSTPPSPPVHPPRPAAHVRPADIAYRHRLEAQLREHRRHVAHLQGRLARLRAQAARIAHSGVGLSGPVGPVVAPVSVPAGPVYVPPPPPVAAPPPPAPPVHTTTGASGHP